MAEPVSGRAKDTVAARTDRAEGAPSHHAERRQRPRALTSTAPLALKPQQSAGVTIRRLFDPRRPEWLVAVASPGSDPDIVDRASRYLGTLQELSDALGRAVTLHDLVETLLSTTLEATAATRVAVLMRRGGHIYMAAMRARSESGAHAAVSPPRETVLDVIEHGVSVLQDRLQSCHDSGEAVDVCSLMCVPLRTATEVLGALYVESAAAGFDRVRLDLLSAIGSQAGLAVHRGRLLRDHERLFFDVIRAIATTIDARDGYTHHHSERVASLAEQIARELGWTESRQQLVHLSGLMHDVGKIAVPDSVLNKPARLTPEEAQEMRRHPEHGARILGEIHSPRIARIIPAVKHHHERWDGTGYPNGLAGDQIPPASRILAVADYLDALTSTRSYKRATSLAQAVTTLEPLAGTAFDPKVVAAVKRLYERGEVS